MTEYDPRTVESAVKKLYDYGKTGMFVFGVWMLIAAFTSDTAIFCLFLGLFIGCGVMTVMVDVIGLLKVEEAEGLRESEEISRETENAE